MAGLAVLPGLHDLAFDPLRSEPLGQAAQVFCIQACIEVEGKGNVRALSSTTAARHFERQRGAGVARVGLKRFGDPE